MSGTTSNERMTANHQFQTLSFQAAESAIHDNFNIPSVVPAVTLYPAREVPAANNYNVNIAGGNVVAVMANADIQFRGEELPMGSGFCNGMAGSCDVDQVFDVRGSGLGLQRYGTSSGLPMPSNLLVDRSRYLIILAVTRTE